MKLQTRAHQTRIGPYQTFFFSGKFSGFDGFSPEKFNGFFRRFFQSKKNQRFYRRIFPMVFQAENFEDIYPFLKGNVSFWRSKSLLLS